MAFKKSVGLIAAALVLTGHIGVLGAQQAPKISTGDQLKITVVNIDMGATDFVVDAEGTINYPNLGRVKVAGLTASEVSALLGKNLVAAEVLTRLPQILVDLKQLESKSVMVAGAVVNRASVSFAGETTLFDVLIKAGGPAPDAGEEIIVTRRPAKPGDEPEQIVVNRRDVESGNFAQNVPIRDGDRIFVPKAEQIYVDGHVNSSGGYIMPPGTTLRQAISLAGGVTELGAINRVKVVRKGKPVDEKLTKDIDKFIVQPGDVITVPKRHM